MFPRKPNEINPIHAALLMSKIKNVDSIRCTDTDKYQVHVDNGSCECTLIVLLTENEIKSIELLNAYND